MTAHSDAVRVLRVLCHWHDLHPDRPISELGLIAAVGIGADRTHAALQRLQDDGNAQPRTDPRNPDLRRWQVIPPP